MKQDQKVEYFSVGLLLVCFFVAFSIIALHRYWQYAAWYYDFGIFYSALGKAAQGLPPTIDHLVFSGKNILGDHFHPIIFLLVPFVALFQTGETLLVMQVLFVTLSGIFIYLLARNILHSKLQSFSFLVLYLSFIGIHNALITEFHEIVLLPLPLSIFFYGLVSKRRWLYFLGFIGVLLTKETTFIIPFWFGILLLFQNSKEWRKIGLGTAVSSVIYFMSVVYLIIPALSGRAYYYFPSSQESTAIVFDALSISSIIKTFASYGFLPLLSPTTLVPVIFNWISRIQRFGNFDLGMHYNAEIAPTLLLAAVYGWQRLRSFLLRKITQVKSVIRFIPLGIAVLSFVFNVQLLKSPLLLLTNQAFFEHTKNFEFLDNLVDQIPEEGVIMAQTNIAAKIANRNTYFLRENYRDFDPDYIVLDLREGQEPSNFYGLNDFDALSARIATDEAYMVYYQQGEQIIYAKK